MYELLSQLKAIRENNVEIAPGRLGDLPAEKGQLITIPLSAQGQLSSVEQFAENKIDTDMVKVNCL